MANIRLSIPITIEKVRPEGEPAFYQVQPVFFDGFEAKATQEDQAIEHLQRDLRRHLVGAARDPNHHLVAVQSFHPPLSRHHLPLQLRLRKQTYSGRFLLVAFPEFGRRVVFCPRLREVNFEWRRGENIEDRATEVLTEYFRSLERDGTADPSAYASPHFARLSQVEVETTVVQKHEMSEGGLPLADLSSTEKVDGGEELERVGRCLDRLYPNRLQRALMRDDLVSQLLALFTGKADSMRPVLLVGPSQVGKTALIHEFVFRRCEDKVSKRGPVWLLNPQRLISGMSHVGEWEGRFLAIMKHARDRKLVVYFDDLLGLFQAGKTQHSVLNAGTLLKAQLEEAPLQVLAECTPEAWRKLKEIDRSLADLFHVIPVREPSEGDTLRILIRYLHQLESERDCRFTPEVLPKVVQLQRRYARARSFPGKGAEFLQQLAASLSTRGTPITGDDALAHFQSKTGLTSLFLDESTAFDRSELKAFFDERIVGQELAVDAMVDAVALSKAQLNDPTRPLASLLFLGPTGVGKTECAKALAEMAFGSSERMLRLDMNEFVGYDATLRLIGGHGTGQGVLTSAIRRQPYTVLLLDEVEKAHPDVFDLLLQVLGEGRLTDFHGQTADFTNAIVILTSNLGARQSRVPLGFSSGDHDATVVYVEAAEKFFRPEFFNRLDRVVPFHELSRKHIEGMVERLARAALARFGFRQRKLMLEVDPDVYAYLTDHGFDPQYGARALRRAIEDHLIQPLASILASATRHGVSTVRVVLGREGKPILKQSSFEAVTSVEPFELPPVTATHVLDILEAVKAFIHRANATLEEMDASFTEDDYAGRATYYDLREHLTWIRNQRERILREAEALLDPRNTTRLTTPPRLGKRATRLRLPLEVRAELLTAVSQAANSAQVLADLVEQAEVQDMLNFQTENLIYSISRLEVQLADRAAMETVTLAFGGNAPPATGGPVALKSDSMIQDVYLPFIQGYEETFTDLDWDPEDGWQHGPVQGFAWQGLAASTLLGFEHGVHLFFRKDGSHQYLETRCGEATPQVIHLHHECGLSVDLRTGVITDQLGHPRWDHIDPHLPLADELNAVLNHG